MGIFEQGIWPQGGILGAACETPTTEIAHDLGLLTIPNRHFAASQEHHSDCAYQQGGAIMSAIGRTQGGGTMSRVTESASIITNSCRFEPSGHRVAHRESSPGVTNKASTGDEPIAKRGAGRKSTVPW